MTITSLFAATGVSVLNMPADTFMDNHGVPHWCTTTAVNIYATVATTPTYYNYLTAVAGIAGKQIFVVAYSVSSDQQINYYFMNGVTNTALSPYYYVNAREPKDRTAPTGITLYQTLTGYGLGFYSSITATGMTSANTGLEVIWFAK